MSRCIAVGYLCFYFFSALRLPNRPAASMVLSATGDEFLDTRSPESLFLRVSIVLRSATFFVTVSEASHLPPPYRIENASPVALFYQQQAVLGGGGVGREIDELADSSAKGGQRNGHWSGGVAQRTLAPRSQVDYAPEEPLLPPILNVGVQVGIFGDPTKLKGVLMFLFFLSICLSFLNGSGFKFSLQIA